MVHLLYLRHQSKGTYETLRQFECITLPSQCTLHDYTHYFKAVSGFSQRMLGSYTKQQNQMNAKRWRSCRFGRHQHSPYHIRAFSYWRITITSFYCNVFHVQGSLFQTAVSLFPFPTSSKLLVIFCMIHGKLCFVLRGLGIRYCINAVYN